ncbi:MAG: glycosyltransferase [Collinsella sp.]
MTSTLPAPIDKLAIVVVTYKRQELLANLFDSMTELTAAPWRIVIVDNENSRETEAMCTAFNSASPTCGYRRRSARCKGWHRRVIYAHCRKRRRCGRLPLAPNAL